MTRSHTSRTRVSIRFIWPYARLVRRYPQGLARVSVIGISAAEYADPDTRIPYADALHLLRESIRISGDPTLGLRAGELAEAGDFDALAYAARSSATVRDAIACIGRYARLMNDAGEVGVIEESDHAIIYTRSNDPTERPPAADDFVMAALMNLARHHATGSCMITEVRFTHGPTEYLNEYDRVFGVPVRFRAEHTALVARRQWLDSPMRLADPALAAAFEQRSRQLLQRVERNHTVGEKVRAIVLPRLSQRDIGMEGVARALEMSVATLRRRLGKEGLKFNRIVQELREEQAQRYLRETGHCIREIAFLLGFADAVSFHKAFKRRTGMTPAEYRTAARER